MSIARKLSKYIMDEINEICENPDCEYQNDCCYWCDVCAMWYSKEEPCDYH